MPWSKQIKVTRKLVSLPGIDANRQLLMSYHEKDRTPVCSIVQRCPSLIVNKNQKAHMEGECSVTQLPLCFTIASIINTHTKETTKLEGVFCNLDDAMPPLEAGQWGCWVWSGSCPPNGELRHFTPASKIYISMPDTRAACWSQGPRKGQKASQRLISLKILDLY